MKKIVILVGSILTVVGIITLGQLNSSNKTGDGVTDISLEGAPLLGNPDAKVTMVEFSDFQCPFCATYDLTVFPEIKKNYIDTGKVRTIFKHFPLPSHSFAQSAAQASMCANDQGKFWEYKDKIFSNQKDLTNNGLKKYANELGLDSRQFDACLNSGKYKTQMVKDLKEGISAKITGTPTFFINRERAVGALPFSEFQKIIEQKLSEIK